MNLTQTTIATTITISALLLSACDDSDSNNSHNNQASDAFTTVQLDSAAQTAYLNLITGMEVTEADIWHLAVNRTSIKLNTNVATALADAQDEYYSAGNPDANLLMNLLPEDEENSLLDFTDDSSLAYIPDGLELVVEQDWYNYDFMTHAISANPESNWIIQSAAGDSYAKMTVNSVASAGGRDSTVIFDFDLQAMGTSAFGGTTSSSFSYTTSSAKTCFDIDTGATASCAGPDWDIAMDGYDFILNGGDSGDGSAAAFGPIASTDIGSYTNGTTYNMTNFTAAYSTDLISGVFTTDSWYAYNLGGAHKLWPNYRVYVVDTDTTATTDEPIKLQLINYYDDTGTSGYITVRFMPLSDS